MARIRAQGCPCTPAPGMSDQPGHARLRKPAQRAFRPRSLSWMPPLVRRGAAELAAALPAGAGLDFLAAFADASFMVRGLRKLPVRVQCRPA